MKRRTAVIKPFITKRQCANNFARSFVNQAPASRPSGVKIKKSSTGEISVRVTGCCIIDYVNHLPVKYDEFWSIFNKITTNTSLYSASYVSCQRGTVRILTAFAAAAPSAAAPLLPGDQHRASIDQYLLPTGP